MQRRLLVSLLLSLLPLVLFLYTPIARASTTINVNSTSDVIANDGACTLREAIIAANTDLSSGGAANECPAGSGVDIINVPAGTYNLSLGGSLEITQSVTIIGNHSPDTIILQTTSDRVFLVSSPANVTLSQLSISEGSDSTGFGGGGIYNGGVLTLSNVTLASNHANSAGGGILNGSGASAVLNWVDLTLNSAGSNGGAIANYGTLTMTFGHLLFQSALNGGNLYNNGIATIYSSIIEAGTASRFGGGVDNNGGVLVIQNSTINANTAHGTGGGLYNDSYASFTNVTLSGNSAISVTVGYGGGVWNTGIVTLTNSTVAYNFASISGGGIFEDGSAGPFNLKNTILAYSSGGGNCGWVIPIVSLGYNLDDGFSCFLSGTGDQSGADPMLRPLSDYGGFVYTHALSPTSPAINVIPYGTNGCSTTITTDARNYARLAPCDIGAFEYVLRLMLPLIKR